MISLTFSAIIQYSWDCDSTKHLVDSAWSLGAWGFDNLLKNATSFLGKTGCEWVPRKAPGILYGQADTQTLKFCQNCSFE